MDQWRNDKYLARQKTESAARQAIAAGRKVYDVPPLPEH
jgi:hypothetical protein